MKRWGCIALLICLLLTGCGGSDANPQESQAVSNQQSVDMSAQPEQPGGAVIQEEKTLHVKKVETVEFAGVEEGYQEHSASYKILGGKIYMFRIESFPDPYEERLCIQIYDTETAELEQMIIAPQVPGHESCSFYSADITAAKELSLKMRDLTEESEYFLVRMNLEGEVLKVTDPFPEEASYPWNRESWEEVSDVFDQDDGRTILGRSNVEEQTTRLTWFDEDTGAETLLGTMESGFVIGLLLTEEGEFYCLSEGVLCRWDAEKNTLESLFRLYENGIEFGFYGTGLILNEEGEILICSMENGKATIHVLTDEEGADEEKIRLCSLEGEAGVSYFQRLAATFTQNGGDIPIKMEMEERQEYQEDYRTRIMAEMVSDQGPDILYVSREDMIMMQERGMLRELTDMIAPETKEVLITAVLDLGTVNGEMVGLVPEVSFVTLGVSNKLWTENSWNMEQLTDLLEGGEWERPFTLMGMCPNAVSLFHMVFFRDPVKAGFLDLEQGTARFDSEEFIAILELCKKYGNNRPTDQLSENERIQQLREGETVAEISYLYGGLDTFSQMAGRFGDDAHAVGFPVESGSGCYVDSYSFGYLVVNANTKYDKEISTFFARLLDYENQFKTNGGCVRMDVIRNSVYFDEGLGNCVMLRSGDTKNLECQELALKPDGTSYLEEYLAFVESCEPVPYCPQQIRTIVGEEIASFFDGQKSAEETADVIQKKVQLYLDETR